MIGKTAGALLGAALFFWGAAPPEAQAFELSPISHHLESSGGAVSGRMTLRNPRSAPLPIETRVVKRHVAENGENSFTPADADFLVFPPQAIVPARGAQAIQFQYVGPSVQDSSAAYVVYVTEVPVAQGPGITVQTVFELGAAVYIHPRGATGDLRLEGVRPLGDGSVEVSVRNQGARLMVLGSRGLDEVPGASAALAPYGAAQARDFGSPILPAHALRRFIVNRAPEPHSSEGL